MTAVRRILGFVLLFLAAGTVLAQSGGLKVQVFGEAGPLAGATVTLSSDRGYVKPTALLTDDRGVALFPILRAGVGYIVEASFPGLSTVRKSGIRILINRTSVEGIRLSAELKESVQVRVERDVVDLEKVETSTRFSDDFIQDLPVPGRFYQNVLTLAPGVQDADGDGNPNVHGSRSRDFKAIVSGVSNVDPLTGQQMNQVNPNSIEEMEVITAGAGVEFGRAQGGFANIIQKQGSNEIEGLVELLYRSDKLDGDAFSTTRGSGVGPVDYRTYQPSIQFSGPIVKDKLWYRLSHELIDREDPVNVTSSVEVVKTRWQINSDQLTWQVTPRNKLALQYQHDPLDITNLGVSSIRGPESSVRSRYGGDTYSLTWTAPYSTRLLVDSTVSYQDTEFRLTPSSPGIANSCYPNSGDSTNNQLVQAFCFDAINSRYSGSYNVDHIDHRQRFTIKSTANLFGGRILGMSHRLKIGFSIENERYFRDLTVRPELTVSFKEGFRSAESEDPKDPDEELPTNEEGGGLGAPPLKAILVARVSIPESVSTTATGTNWAVFLEDQVKPLSNLSLTFGVRADSEQLNGNGRSDLDTETDYNRYLEGFTAIEAATGEPPTITEQLDLIVANFMARGDIHDFYHQVGSASGFPLIGCSGLCSSSARLRSQQQPDSLSISNLNLSPFLSAAWDPWSDGKTKLSFAAGRHYNNTILSIPLHEARPVSADVAIGCERFACRVGNTSIVPNVTQVRQDLRTPYQDEWVVAFERELLPETMARVTYINRKYRDQFQDQDLNHIPGDYRIDSRCRFGPDDDNLGSDGVEDDCTGNVLPPPFVPPGQIPEPPIEDPPPFGFGFPLIVEPDGFSDLYIQNPFWGEVFQIGNFNRSDYEAYVLEIVRRQYRGWELQGSYAWSRSTGDGEDFGQGIGDDRSLVDDEYGYQSQDQRHVVKLNATTVTPWGFRLGTTVTWQSGLPFSVVRRSGSLDAVPPPLGNLGLPAIRTRTSYTDGSRNSGRNISWWNVNTRITREMNLRRGMNLQLSAEVYNLLDSQVLQIYNPATESGRRVNGENEARVTTGRSYQLSGKLTF